MARLAATLPGYASVLRASEVLHLAPRSVRDLIYAGRIPSLRIGRLHYIRAADLEQERRRRLGLPLARRRRSSSTARRHQPGGPREPRNHSLDAALRRQRASEREELAVHWARRHGVSQPLMPAHVREVSEPFACESCGRKLRSGRYIAFAMDSQAPSQLCLMCGRRALLEWADLRRQESSAARQMAHSLGAPEGNRVDPRPAELLQQVLLAPTEPPADTPARADQPDPTNPRAA
jgi:hypothetical protein